MNILNLNMLMKNLKKIIRPYINYRKLRLLGFVDLIDLIKESVKTRKQNLNFLSKHKNFPVPPKHLAFDAYSHTNWQVYFDTGKDNAKHIAKIIQEYGANDYLKICEWGCGPARILRHLRENIPIKHLDLYGVDYNRETINWCAQNIQDVTFSVNSLAPPLELNENYFDCVYAISVFTHLSEAMHYPWIKELMRVTKKNGLIIITTLGDKFKDLLTHKEKEIYESGKLVNRGAVREGKKFFNAFHPAEFMIELFSKVNLVLVKHITDHEMLGFNQDIWLLKKKEI